MRQLIRAEKPALARPRNLVRFAHFLFGRRWRERVVIVHAVQPATVANQDKAPRHGLGNPTNSRNSNTGARGTTRSARLSGARGPAQSSIPDECFRQGGSSSNARHRATLN
ncbi:hypothetical protein MRX96_002457 [Rhipicephalus microplus]